MSFILGLIIGAASVGLYNRYGTDKDAILVAFGNFVLDQRKNKADETKDLVTHADLSNFKDL